MKETSPDDGGQHRIRHLLRRFPQYERAIRELHATHVGFQSLCDDYRELSEKLEGSGSQGDMEAGEGARLKHRHAALEEELLGFIEGSART